MINFKKLAIFLAMATTALGASVDAIVNTSPTYLANPAQNASTDAEAAFSNPAGLTELEDGFYIQTGLQLARVTFEIEQSQKYDAIDDKSIIPNVNLIKKNGNYAYYLNLGAAGGGPNLKYDEGIPMLDQFLAKDPTALNRVEGSNKYMMLSTGLTYKVDEKWSISGGLRYIIGTRDIKVEVDGKIPQNPLLGTLDAKRKADGFGGVFGINYKANEDITIALTYFTKVELEFESNTTISGNLKNSYPLLVGTPSDLQSLFIILSDGNKSRRDLPAQGSLGLSYRFNDKIKLMAGTNYYFFEDANIDNNSGFKNGYEISIGTEYKISDKILLMAGYNYADTGADESTFNDTEFGLDSHIYGFGFRYSINKNLSTTLGFSYIDYIDKNVGNSNYEKEIICTGLSFTYKI